MRVCMAPTTAANFRPSIARPALPGGRSCCRLVLSGAALPRPALVRLIVRPIRPCCQANSYRLARPRATSVSDGHRWPPSPRRSTVVVAASLRIPHEIASRSFVLLRAKYPDRHQKNLCEDPEGSPTGSGGGPPLQRGPAERFNAVPGPKGRVPRSIGLMQS